MPFFLLPKSETAYLLENNTVRQGLEKMQHYGYTAVPVLDEDGRYVGSITVADFLWYIKDIHDMSLASAGKMPLKDVPRRHDNQSVAIDAKITDMFHAAMEQNFIPVVDDFGVFIGIVRRRAILEYYMEKFLAANGEAPEEKIYQKSF
ncbi:MAG: CBS domain-containing protein [Bacillota bacterium]